MPIETATIVEILPTRIWIESDFLGGRHVVLQHEGCEPFTYASFPYDYRYTSNAGTYAAARQMALALGATEPIEERTRSFAQPIPDGLYINGERHIKAPDDNDYDLHRKAVHKRGIAASNALWGMGWTYQGDQWIAPAAATAAQPPQAVPTKCPHCGTHEVALLLECHNSACVGYAESSTVYEGWKQAGATADQPQIDVAGTVITAFGPKISEQCAKHGLRISEPELVDKLRASLLHVYRHGLLTTEEADRAALQLLKLADIRAASQQEERHG